jgi:TonB-linked SusC/RagA family outer membrane protein
MDMNRVQSITILKDASAKAIYGSKGANGVIVIETKALGSDRTLVTYTGSVTVEAPDLTSYNLCNAYEKLMVEDREGLKYYDGTVHGSYSTVVQQNMYYERLKRAMEGESTYWLSKPVRIGFGHKHSLGVEMGGKDLKTFLTFSYNDVQGAMKGSKRDIISGDANVSYRAGNWVFRNIMSITSMNGTESPWGSFSEYAACNPYFTPYDENGNVKKFLYKGYVGEYIEPQVTNPMWNAFIGTSDTSQYLDFTDNFYVEYHLAQSLKLVARMGIDTKKTQYDRFLPAEHTDFVNKYGNALSAEEYINRGSYTLTTGNYINYSADASAQFNRTFADRHYVFATAQYNISEMHYDEVTNTAYGFPNSYMKNYALARTYETGSSPTGGDGINRNLGALLTAGYSFDNRYMMDATIKTSASSVFGSNRRWGIFWSAGVAWNLHNEAFMEGAKDWLKTLKIRASVGSSGNQNYANNISLPVYSYYNSNYYNGFTGAVLKNMENPDLQWEEKMDYNVGVDFRTKRINAVLDAYIADTRNLVFNRSIVPSTGFSTVVDNMGKVRNRGVEASLSYILFQTGSSYLSVFGKVAFNDNRILQISEALEAYNKQQAAAAEALHSPLPVVQYYNGMPLHSIWAVESLGIDSRTGNEVFIDRDGNMTTTWDSKDLKNFGSSDPVYNGNFGINGEIASIGVNIVMTYYGGGKRYNTTLLNKVENVDLSYNVDRRIFEGRWFKSGQNTPYRGLDSRNNNEEDGFMEAMTRATSRFIQKNNVLNIATVSVYYEFPQAVLQKLRMDRLRATLYTNDLYTFSSIQIERGTSYPYARSFSFSLTATF